MCGIFFALCLLLSHFISSFFLVFNEPLVSFEYWNYFGITPKNQLCQHSFQFHMFCCTNCKHSSYQYIQPWVFFFDLLHSNDHNILLIVPCIISITRLACEFQVIITALTRKNPLILLQQICLEFHSSVNNFGRPWVTHKPCMLYYVSHCVGIFHLSSHPF